MKLVVFGLSITSAWGNGHATLWRGLCAALQRKGHQVVFFERDTPYYAAHRDPLEACHCDVRIYRDWPSAQREAVRELARADAAMVTSYCPDGPDAAELIFSSAVPFTAFYDLDSPVTLAAVRSGERVPYLPPNGLCDFDIVLSYTGGSALADLRTLLGAKRVAPLYGSVDPAIHAPCPPIEGAYADLSYLGTYAADRQATLETLFFAPARLRPGATFALAGAQYPPHIALPPNVSQRPHVAPSDHPAFYCSSALTLNVTRKAMIECGYCPSARLFEAAACGVPVVSDTWPGLEEFFEPAREILIAHSTDCVLRALSLAPAARAKIAERARARVLAEHTADRRADELLALFPHSRPKAAVTNNSAATTP